MHMRDDLEVLFAAQREIEHHRVRHVAVRSEPRVIAVLRVLHVAADVGAEEMPRASLGFEDVPVFVGGLRHVSILSIPGQILSYDWGSGSGLATLCSSTSELWRVT